LDDNKKEILYPQIQGVTVMIQIQRHIGSSTNLWAWLKSLVTLHLMRLMALQDSKLILMISMKMKFEQSQQELWQ
jgi:hypothetical protein